MGKVRRQSVTGALKHELMPISLFGKFSTQEDAFRGAIQVFRAWCCYYRSDAGSLYVSDGVITDCSSLADVHLAVISNSRAVKSRGKPTKDEHQDRMHECMDRGFELIEGNWYIQQRKKILVDRNRLLKAERSLMIVPDVRANGFESKHDPQRIDNRPDILQRLIESNPNADSWIK